MTLSSHRLTLATRLKWSRKLIVPLYGRTNWGALTTTIGCYAGCDDDEDDSDVPMPTGNDDALDDDEGTIAGIVLTEFIAIDADTLAASPHDTKIAEATVVAPTVGGIVTKEDSAFTAEVPTDGVGTATLT